jgi:hypothetical protein
MYVCLQALVRHPGSNRVCSRGSRAPPRAHLQHDSAMIFFNFFVRSFLPLVEKELRDVSLIIVFLVLRLVQLVCRLWAGASQTSLNYVIHDFFVGHK